VRKYLNQKPVIEEQFDRNEFRYLCKKQEWGSLDTDASCPCPKNLERPLNMAINPIRAVVFDLGGTLEDLYDDHRDSP
jgi:hypothetical protein